MIPRRFVINIKEPLIKYATELRQRPHVCRRTYLAHPPGIRHNFSPVPITRCPHTSTPVKERRKKMRKLLMITTLMAPLMAMDAVARDDVGDYSFEDAMALEQTRQELDGDIRFYFGDQQPAGEITQRFGEFQANKKTNAFNKSDTEACQWVFLSAMMSLRDRALREGGNAVINIKSNYKDNETVSNETFKCAAGTFVAGTTLLGTVVTLEE